MPQPLQVHSQTRQCVTIFLSASSSTWKREYFLVLTNSRQWQRGHSLGYMSLVSSGLQIFWGAPGWRALRGGALPPAFSLPDVPPTSFSAFFLSGRGFSPPWQDQGLN